MADADMRLADGSGLAIAARLAGTPLPDKPVIIPGWPNKVTAAGGWLTPRRLLVPMLAKQHPALD